MPYLTQIEKKWISFQIIYGLTQIHNKGLCHGDIKLENILLSSNGSVFLCDLAPYKPAYMQSKDNSSFAYYFGTNSSIKSCYLAPEVVDKQELNELNNSIYKLTTAMNIFLAGAVIAELFLEDLLFDHEKLILFKSEN
jgi:phosphoinositide-3-kinase regulatory subunit 4